ncbi:hypothetical protein P3X46_016882 [Hevea brasiliensis]|uniref:Uncharacterized protein n=1 Tax=Hevea brasiliensis TaxID=3981 RepID=A0ABQ9M1P9_HEVBR|nr:hypothetical protein P3X46_016882 [Hevea brasiliensis]
MPSITRPRVEANNFELKPALCQMVQQSQFGGNPSESPHVHLAHFLEISDMLKINGVSDDAIRLRLFPFSLKDRATDTIDASSGGDLMEKSEDEAFFALDKIAYNNYQWSCERNEIKKPAGMFELDAIKMINAKFDALTRKMDKLSVKVDSSIGGSSNSVEVRTANVNCAVDFSALNQDFSSEQVDYVGNYNQRPGGKSFSATYDPAWRNHPNFSWGGRHGQNQNFQQPSGYQQHQNFQQNRGPPSRISKPQNAPAPPLPQ